MGAIDSFMCPHGGKGCSILLSKTSTFYTLLLLDNDDGFSNYPSGTYVLRTSWEEAP